MERSPSIEPIPNTNGVRARSQILKVDYVRLTRAPETLNTYPGRLRTWMPLGILQLGPQTDQFAGSVQCDHLRVVRDHYPSAASAASACFLGVWRETEVLLAGQSMSLDHLEHKILRPDYGDPRIHFALVCAAEDAHPFVWNPIWG